MISISMLRKHKHRTMLKNIIIGVVALGFFIAGGMVLWLVSIRVPDLQSFENRVITSSTKVYDRTGQVLLYDFHDNVKRTAVPIASMSNYVKNATVAIEDSNFYNNNGIEFKSLIRSFLVDVLHASFSQGGSTITQQIVKNALLTQDKTLIRKVKEIVLSLKVSREMTKDQILELYLNEAPYGGSIYGIEVASETYFGKHAADLDLAESAYMAAIPQAPSRYSPYGNNKQGLEDRKNLVLSRMHDLGFITDTEYASAKTEVVAWQPQETTGIKAPHFVFFIKDYLENKYGPDILQTGGLKVTTTLDYGMEQKAEEIVKRRALTNEKTYNASNEGMVAIDPKTGQILVMVGSRDYFDKEIDGQYNIATAERQPGSAFKPFVYALAFNDGYTPNTILFDVPTEFNSGCNAYGYATSGVNQKDCYMPQDYDGGSRGPMTIRNALAQSINIPAVKMLYLVGIDNAIKIANDMGIRTLTTAKQYGLTLVLGGGEVRLLDMTSAYGVFAAGGVLHAPTPIMKIENPDGSILEQYTQDDGVQVLPKQTALEISSILADNAARTPIFGPKSSLYVPNHDVAVKTGTTNDFKDAWVIGYTPSLVVGGWAGNNDDTPMAKKISAVLAAPTWNEFMTTILANTPNEPFEAPTKDPNYDNLKPVIRGVWQGGESYTIDTISGKLATAATPEQTRKEYVYPSVHDILYWVDKTNPLGPKPANPYNDPQFKNWETAAQDWWGTHAGKYSLFQPGPMPTSYDDVHTDANKPQISIISPKDDVAYDGGTPLTVQITSTGHYPLTKFDVFLNDAYVGTNTSGGSTFTFVPDSTGAMRDTNELRVIGYDTVYNSNETSVPVNITGSN